MRQASAPRAQSSVLNSVTRLDQESTPVRIAERLRLAIVNGQLPPGTQMTEIPLAARLGVSRGPVREAVQRLIQEGLLTTSRHRGVFVVDLQPAEIDDLYVTRELIESGAAQRLAKAAGRGRLDALTRALTALRRAEATGVWRRLVDADLGFHAALVATGGTTRLRRTFDTLSVETRICLNRLEPFYPQRRDVVAEHEAIFRAIEGGDSEGVAALIHQHMHEAAARLTTARLKGAEQAS